MTTYTKTIKGINMQKDEYRFENGSLFLYNSNSNSYIHVFKSYRCTDMKSAVKEYEQNELNLMEDV